MNTYSPPEIGLALVRATEAAALACAGLMGRGDETEADQVAAMHEAGLEPLHCYVSPEEAWAGYHRLVIESADTYDGPALAVNARSMAREWKQEFERDRRVLEWTVWVAKKPDYPLSP